MFGAGGQLVEIPLSSVKKEIDDGWNVVKKKPLKEQITFWKNLSRDGRDLALQAATGVSYLITKSNKIFIFLIFPIRL